MVFQHFSSISIILLAFLFISLVFSIMLSPGYFHFQTVLYALRACFCVFVCSGPCNFPTILFMSHSPSHMRIHEASALVRSTHSSDIHRKKISKGNIVVIDIVPPHFLLSKLFICFCIVLEISMRQQTDIPCT